MIEIKDLDFSYGKGAPALQSVSLTAAPGIHLLAGENGAGKTTLLHLVAGVSRPGRGTIRIDGVDPAADLPAEMGRVFLLEESQFFPGRSIRHFAALHSRFYPRFSPELFMSNLAAFGLTGDEAIDRLSLGNRKKSQLAYVLALRVPVLLLDEPTNALDIEGRATLRHLIGSSVSESQTVIVSTHAVSELENLYDGIIMLSRSRLVYSGTSDEVSSRLAFRVSRLPLPESIYMETQIGRVLNVLPADADDEQTSVNWRLLYSAIHSPMGPQVLRCLKQTDPSNSQSS